MNKLKMYGYAVLTAVMIPGAAQAQTAPAPVAQAAVDPGRLAEAHKLIDVLMPPATRDQMLASIMTTTMNNMVKGITGNPDFQNALDMKPGARDVFSRFIDRQQEIGLADLREHLPAMIEAMAHAYARRFTVDQMHEMEAFFSTPTGRLYMEQANQIMADPDVAAWQQGIMSRAMARMPTEMNQLQRDIMALDSKGAPHAP